MNEKQIAEIDSLADMIELPAETIHALTAEVRRLRAVMEKYADPVNWEPSGEFTGHNDVDIVYLNNLWAGSVHGYAIAKNALKGGE